MELEEYHWLLRALAWAAFNHVGTAVIVVAGMAGTWYTYHQSGPWVALIPAVTWTALTWTSWVLVEVAKELHSRRNSDE